jgi:replicative DNA helicase
MTYDSRLTTKSTLLYGKVPPQSIDMEQAVLGACMLEQETFAVVMEVIPRAECFYVDAHRRVYGAMLRLFANGTPVDLLTITEELRKAGELDMAGGAYGLTCLTQSVLTSAHVEAHARVVMEKHMQRELIRISGNVISEAYEERTDIFDLLDKAQAGIYALTGGNLKKNYQGTEALARAAMERQEYLRNNPTHLTGVPSGYRTLDALTCGWQRADLIILAARPSVGKTAFAINLALNAASSPIKRTGAGIFSLEMSADQITNRAISSMSRIDYQAITRGRLTDDELRRFNETAQKFAGLNIKVDDTPALSILELRARARRMVEKDGVGIIFIDYLQIMRGLDSSRNTTREQEISKISRDLKALGKELQVPIIALSQMSRGVEGRATKKPQLSDLRESGAIEQDADLVLFLSRPDYQKKEHEIDPRSKDDVEINFAKHRNGATEEVALKFKKEIQTFLELEEWWGCLSQEGKGLKRVKG